MKKCHPFYFRAAAKIAALASRAQKNSEGNKKSSLESYKMIRGDIEIEEDDLSADFLDNTEE